MAILEKEVWIKYNSKTIKYYEAKGYIFPRIKDKEGKLRIKKGTKILVRIEDITDGSSVEVTKICDICGKHVIQKYCGILICRKNNIDKCLECQTIEKGIKKGIANESTCVSTTHPEFAKMFWNKEDTFKYTYRSGKKIDFKCPECGSRIEQKTIANVFRQGLSCPKCSDGISYPEKFMFNVLEQLNVNFDFQKTFPWSDNKKYDFYIHSLNYIIETHGKQHYEGGFERYGDNARTLDEEISNDYYKNTLAMENGIREDKYIVIDARKSSLDFLRNSILKSELFNIFDLTGIDWGICHEFACKTLVKETCVAWIKNKNVTAISKELKLDRATVRKYLKQGLLIGWCNYDSELNMKKSKPVVQLTLSGNIIAEYASQKDAERKCGISANAISSACSGRYKTAKGFKWMYKEDYDSTQEE